MFGIGMTELVVVMIIVLLIFGGSKISGIGRSLGEAISEFKEAVKPEDKEPEEPKKKKEAEKSKENKEPAATTGGEDEE